MRKRRPSVTVKCAVCRTEFKTYACRLAAGGGKYCSCKCAGASIKTRVPTKCARAKCGAEFETKPCLLAIGRGKYCSRTCVDIARRAGGIRQRPRSAVPLASRFWAKVAKASEDECWLWTAKSRVSGYGSIGNKKPGGGHTHVLAHRAAWELTNGPIKDGLLVCHKCDVKLCCNPKHLFLGNYRDNAKDMCLKGRHRHGLGVKQRKRLTVDEVARIQHMRHSLGMKQREIADSLGINYQAVWRATSGRIRGV